jgi:hypothetical protein
MSVAEQMLSQYPRSQPLHSFESTHAKVAFAKVEEKEKEIEKKYEVSRYFGQLPYARQKEIVLNSDRWDVVKMIATVVLATGIGTGLGALSGYSVRFLFRNRAEVVPLATASGALAGVSIGYKIAISNFVKSGPLVILQSEEFNEWKAGLSKEKYDLFLNCLKNHIDIDHTFEDFVCPITLDIPKVPVVCPNGHVYEKDEIEKHLDLRWAAVQRLVTSGYSQDKIDEALRTVSPMRGAAFTKEDLKYAVPFVVGAIEHFKGVINILKAQNPDAIVIEGLKRLVKQYQETYQAVTDEAISLLTKDILLLGGNDDLRRQFVALYRRNAAPDV